MNPLHDDPEFILSGRFGNSITRFQERYENGAPDHVIASVLDIEEEDVQPEYERIIAKIRGLMGVE